MSTSLEEALGASPVPTEPVVPVAEPVVEPDAPEAEPEAQPEPEAAEVVEPEKPEPHMVPVSVVKELRDEIRSLKSRIEPRPEPVPLPDVLDNPDGFVGHIQEQVNQAVTNATFNLSKTAAVRQYGKDAVEAAEASIQIGSPEHLAIQNAVDPYTALMEIHQRQQMMAEIGEDPAAYRARIVSEERAKWDAEQAAKQVKGVAPPPSLASNPNVSGRSGPAWAPTSLAAALNGRR